MSVELKWLLYTIILTSLMWLPYILNRIQVRGLLPALGYQNTTAHAPWAERAICAHTNAVENLVLFAPLILILHTLGISTQTTQMAAATFFVARVAHYFVYVMAIPVARTLTFAAGWAATLALAFAALGAVG